MPVDVLVDVGSFPTVADDPLPSYAKIRLLSLLIASNDDGPVMWMVGWCCDQKAQRATFRGAVLRRTVKAMKSSQSFPYAASKWQLYNRVRRGWVGVLLRGLSRAVVPSPVQW